MAESRNATFESHIQTAMQTVIIMIITWVGVTTSESSVKIAALSAEVESLQHQIDLIQQQQQADIQRRLEALEK